MKTDQLFTNPWADVEITPVQIAGEDIASKSAIRVKSDDGTWTKHPSIVSSDYRLIRNDVARDLTSDIMSRSGMKWKALKTLWDGKRLAAYYITEEKVAEAEGGAVGHPIHVGMMIRNTYDGSGVFGLEIFAANMHCTNQYIDRNRFGYFAIRHDSGANFDVQDAVANLSSGVTNVLSVAPVLSQMRKTPLTLEHVLKAREETNVPKSMWGAVLTQLALEEATLFGLYQALTYVASHEVSGFNSLYVGESVSRFSLPATPAK